MPSYSGVWNPVSQYQAKGAGNWPANYVPPPTIIGQAYGGGFYAGKISTAGNGVADYYLIVAPAASGQSGVLQFKTSTTDDPGAISAITGPANSASMNNADHPAVQFCEDLSIGGFSDWYMPSQNELEVCYYNLKPGTATNAADPNNPSGINANAVPPRASVYTAGTPAQTTAANFQEGGAEAFIRVAYYCSTQQAAAFAFRQTFEDGLQAGTSKTNASRVRAVRRVPV